MPLIAFSRRQIEEFPMSPAKSPPIANKLLAALPKKEYQALRSQLEEIPLVFEEILYKPEDLISDIYFPNHGYISLLAGLNERSSLEVGLVGREGVLGLTVFMGVSASQNRAVVQGAGSAMKMNATAFRREINNGGALPRVLRRYTHSLLTQITQTAVCNQFHSIEARLARWLLLTQDRMEHDEFELTQEFLSNMLAVRREGVNKAASRLQKRNLIRYSRGHLKVLDRAGLEATSCGCYQIIKDEGSRS
jgi:CRP-like cAMP-binding protein